MQLLIYAGARAVHSQLAFLALLQPQLPSLKRTVAFDPVFSTLDKTLLQTFHIEVTRSGSEHATMRVFAVILLAGFAI